MNTTMATDFLTRCFQPGETIAILIRREEPAKVAQRAVRLELAIGPAFMRWLAHENSHGMNVYVAANPLRAGSRKRTKECIAEVRHLYLDIDQDGDARLAALRASDEVPTPNVIVSTSPGKYQVLWRVTGFEFASQESALKQLVIAFGGDSACTDCNRVIRIPGFHNAKYTPAHPVSVQYLSALAYSPDDFPVLDFTQVVEVPLRSLVRLASRSKHTNSEQDWAWVISELSSGKSIPELTKILAERRSDKPKPLYYAQRTVDIASARLALIAGTPIQDVIADLETRHTEELSAVLRSARAREIARTAAQMIAH